MTIDEICVFDNYNLLEMCEGRVVLTTTVSQTALNLYGKAHGGYLFTLADQVSGLALLSTGYTAVTLQSSINYLKAVNLGDQLTVTSHISHQGRTTAVVDVTTTNQDNQTVTKGTFTMFVTGERPTD